MLNCNCFSIISTRQRHIIDHILGVLPPPLSKYFEKLLHSWLRLLKQLLLARRAVPSLGSGGSPNSGEAQILFYLCHPLSSFRFIIG